MALPNFRSIQVKSPNFEDLRSLLTSDLNLKCPVYFNLLELSDDYQREIIGFLDNFFETENYSCAFPYPIYLITVFDSSITKIPVVRSVSELPAFFSAKPGRLNVKETRILDKNKLLQQEIQNVDAEVYQDRLTGYALEHRQISTLEKERSFYRSLLDRLVKGRHRG